MEIGRRVVKVFIPSSRIVLSSSYCIRISMHCWQSSIQLAKSNDVKSKDALLSHTLS